MQFYQKAVFDKVKTIFKETEKYLTLKNDVLINEGLDKIMPPLILL